ncbi:hypothetical protein [Fundidesulfovibrio magnetotacticus]|uniref:hypothetical protein n=1 Tax=Fundidesulfovibrio magnetotacticus TaxID=2730080 RepID=UPI00156309F7|nr:hypothetical protein [Fundidesulfovibrio magnetotacticus]
MGLWWRFVVDGTLCRVLLHGQAAGSIVRGVVSGARSSVLVCRFVVTGPDGAS